MFVPLTQKKIAQMIFELAYYGYNVPETDMRNMSSGTIILRYNQFMKKVKEDKDNENKILEMFLKRACPLMMKK